MRAVVLGACGAVGREVSVGLARSPEIKQVALADLDAGRLRLLARRLPTRVAVHRVDAASSGDLRQLLRGVDLVVNCTTYHFGLPVLTAAIAERADYIDVGGLYNTPRQLALDGRARRAGVRAVIGCGTTPGLSNVLARRGAERMDTPEEVHISFASHRDLAPSPGLLDTLLDEFRPGVDRFIWRDGRLRAVRPFDGARTVRFPPPLGMQRVFFVPHSETYTLPRSLGNGLREVTVRGTWRPEHMRLLQSLTRLGMTSERPVNIEGRAVRPLDVLRAVLLRDPPEDAGAPWAFFLHVEVAGRAGGERVVVVHRASHPLSWGKHATGRMTAVPVIAAAELLARSEVGQAGVLPPEMAFEPEAFLAEVRAAGIRVTARKHQASVPYRRSPKSPSPGRM
jgi:saccharopine dehydrogenase-like NADP-dependent oxidoreductase